MVEAAKPGRNVMSVSLGVSCGRQHWQTCLMEKGHVLELNSFVDPGAARTCLEHTCVLYPEPNIVVAAAINTPFTRLVDLSHECFERVVSGNDALQDFLIAIGYSNVASYVAPSVKFLSSVPLHRKLMREDLGTSDKLCAFAALLLQLRTSEATWPEMNFMFLEVDNDDWSVLIAEDGRVVNGMTSGVKTGKQFEEASKRAYWEGLNQELAGLMAIHHFDEIVVMGRLIDAFIERFADSYQVYLFPYAQAEFQGFEAALGAATVAEGLYGHGIAAEIVGQLQISGAISSFDDETDPRSFTDRGSALNFDRHLASMPASRRSQESNPFISPCARGKAQS